jgi:hypothetical protein
VLYYSKPLPNLIHKNYYSMRLLIFFVCLLGFSLVNAQTEISVDGPALAYRTTTTTSLSEYSSSFNGRDRTLLGDLNLTGIWGGPTYNYSMTGEDWALVRGGFGGLEFGGDFFLGYGGWKAREDFMTDDVNDNTRYEFKHSGFVLAYTPFHDNAIHPRITTIIGPGKIEVAGEGKDRMLIGQAMVGLELNLFQWFRLGVDAGYRFANGVDSNVITDKDVSGSILQIEARFGFSD